MYTQCPHCQTIFGVSKAHLSAAFGRVRCGHCSGQFNAKRHLLDEIPEQSSVSEPPPPLPVIREQTSTTEPAETKSEEIEPWPSDMIPANEIDHIDLTNAIKESTETEPVTTNSDEPSEIGKAETTKEPAQIQNTSENQELDAIFAALDNRLEALSENTDDAVIKPFEKFEANNTRAEGYNEAFGDPDSQTKDDIKASIETIFAAAEAELIRSNTTDDHENHADNNIPQETLLAKPHIELIGIDKQHPHENVFRTENSEEIEDFELVTNDKKESNAKQTQSDLKNLAFEQEELPFALHEALSTEQTPPRSWPKTFALLSLILLLLLSIGFQLALFRNVELAQKLPVITPYLVKFCRYLPCQFTGLRDVTRITLTSRDVRIHPKDKNAILISAIFVNNAPFDQPYPDIMVTLSDLTSTVVARRRFTPHNYLLKANAFQLMKPSKPIHISLEVLDPGNDAVNFQFKFL